MDASVQHEHNIEQTSVMGGFRGCVGEEGWPRPTLFTVVTMTTPDPHPIFSAETPRTRPGTGIFRYAALQLLRVLFHPVAMEKLLQFRKEVMEWFYYVEIVGEELINTSERKNYNMFAGRLAFRYFLQC